jgi:hypothetical protein
VEESRLANAAARMMQVFQEGVLTLQKLKTGGKQTMVVQHVEVSHGGQPLSLEESNLTGNSDSIRHSDVEQVLKRALFRTLDPI